MSKLAQLKQFEEDKLKEIQEYKAGLQQDFLALEDTYQQKVKSVMVGLSSYREEIRDKYMQMLQSQSREVTQSVDSQISKLSSYESSVEEFAQEIAKMIVGL